MMRPIALPPEAALIAAGAGLTLGLIYLVRRLGPDIWVLINALLQPRGQG
jgi:hypothetical protein